MKSTLLTVMVMLLCGFITPPVRAQAVASATLGGTVKAENGTPLVGAVITSLHLPTGTRRVATADESGHFEFKALLTGGPYGLQVSLPGFRPQVIHSLFLTPDAATTLTLVLLADVVAVGTRRADRTALESVAPVDVVDMRNLALTAPRVDNTQLLNYVVPSFNSVRETSADGSDHVDGATLRGLGSDQVLVLVNGKRRHTSALINLLGSRAYGSATTDLNTISANALDRVEILRDG
ncbi:MAG TPA: TonB-dependent receptor, partial [Hymenobacter sp.]